MCQKDKWKMESQTCRVPSIDSGRKTLMQGSHYTLRSLRTSFCVVSRIVLGGRRQQQAHTVWLKAKWWWLLDGNLPCRELLSQVHFWRQLTSVPVLWAVGPVTERKSSTFEKTLYSLKIKLRKKVIQAFVSVSYGSSYQESVYILDFEWDLAVLTPFVVIEIQKSTWDGHGKLSVVVECLSLCPHGESKWDKSWAKPGQ